MEAKRQRVAGSGASSAAYEAGSGQQDGAGIGGRLGGGGIAAGLGPLVQAFEQSGQGDGSSSWVGNGQNQPVAPTQETQALVTDTTEQLAARTRLSPTEVAAQPTHLSPHVVDRLTRNGRVPTPAEAVQWV